MNRYDNYNPSISDTSDLGDPIYSHEGEEYSEDRELPAAAEITPQKTGRRTKAPAKKTRKAREKAAVEKEPGVSLKERIVGWFTQPTLRWLLGIFLVCFGTYLAVAFVSYFSSCVMDQSEIHNSAIGQSDTVTNLAGEAGARLADQLIDGSFGVGSIVIIIWVFAMALKLFGTGLRYKTVNFTIKCLVALIAVSLIVGLLTIGFDTPVNWGGIHGRYVNEFVIHFLGWIGAFILCAFVIALFVAICLRDLVKWILRVKREHAEKRAVAKAEREAREAREEELRQLEEEELAEARNMVYDGVHDEEESTGEQITVDFTNPGVQGAAAAPAPAEYEIREIEDEPEENPLSLRTEPLYDEAPEEPETPDTPQDSGFGNDGEPEQGPQPAKHPKMVVNVNEISEVKAKRPTPNKGYLLCQKYKFPPFELLREGENKVRLDEFEQLENRERIRTTLADFGINITSIEATIGPTVTLYEIVPYTGVKIAKIASLANDLALRLAAPGVRIIPQVPGRGTVGIEVPNKDPQVVSMRTVLKSRKFAENHYHLPIALGSTISNDVYVTDLAKMPHLLVAGATGQGKSVGLNVIINSLLYSKRPDELKFVMIDPKTVEFSIYSKLENHYLAKLPGEDEPIVTDMDKVVPVLLSLVQEMENRYQLLKNARLRKLEEYNEKFISGEITEEEGHRFLPYIVLVVDEYADLVMSAKSPKDIEVPISRLAQKARAVGIHVIIATQRPSTNVITGIIKANFIARIAFKVSSGVDSKTILDTVGAQALIGRGDMLVSQNSELVRVQCAFIDTPECEAICDYIERQPFGSGPYLLPDPPVSDDEPDFGRPAGASAGDRDPLFEEIARKIVTTSSASTSSLQRAYGLGFARAGRIMDQLEAAGVVGPSHNGKPREVLMDSVTVENLFM